MSAFTLPSILRSTGGAARYAPQLGALALALFGNWLVSPQFFNIQVQDGRLFGSVVDVFNRGAPVTLLALGMTLVIATGGIDLSVGAVMAISGAVAATLVNSGLPVWEVIALSLAVGVACGIWNGFLVSVLKIQPIVTTLILMVAGRGIAQLITEGVIVTFVQPQLMAVGSGTVFTVPMPVVITACMFAFTLVLTRTTALGLMIESAGINARSSALAGVNTRVVITAAYLWCGLCAAAAGLIVTADIRGADANNIGLWLELDAILSVVIGGTSLLGGRFSLTMSIVGALIIQAVNTGILLSGFPPEFNMLVKSAVVLIILFVQSPELATLRTKLVGRRAAK
jgi:galactofuranose transport system permease protein